MGPRHQTLNLRCLGANNEEILCSIGSVSPEELERMQSDGVV